MDITQILRSEDRIALLAILESEVAAMEALFAAADLGAVWAIPILLGRVDPNIIDVDGLTALHHAAKAANSGCVAVLLLAGARHDARDRSGMTALHYAAAANSIDCVRDLLAYGADTTAQDGKGRTAYDIAHSMRNVRAISALRRGPSRQISIKK